jgi:hypothetical protein
MPTSAQLEQQRKEGRAAAEKYFAPVLAERLKAHVERGLAAQRDSDFRALGAGISNLVVRSVTFDDLGSTAIVHATFTHWATSADWNPDGSWSVYTPSNDVEVTVQMARQPDGSWVVTDYQWDFLPGSEP